MAHRKQNIRYLIKKALNEQDVSSDPNARNKHQDKIKTYEERKKAKEQGASIRERDEINFSKKKLYSVKTRETYIREADKFADFLESRNMKKCSMKQAKKMIQPYMNDLIAKDYSAATIHLKLASVCKIFGCYMRDYSIPQRSVAAITRGRKTVRNDTYNEKNHADILNANRLIGVRRSELARIKVGDVEIQKDKIIIHTIGKGKKRNVQVFFDETERQQIRDWCKNKAKDEYLFDRHEILHSDCDFHSCRTFRAKTVYERVLNEMEQNPERRNWYYNYVVDELTRQHKRIPPNLDKKYCCRGALRDKMIREGRPYEFDRLAFFSSA